MDSSQTSVAPSPFEVRKAREEDIRAIHALLTIYARDGIVLERSEADLAFYLGNFRVAVDRHGRLLGCVALRDFGGDLVEVRSLAVQPECKGLGVGRALVEAGMADVRTRREHGRLFALTLQPGFFQKLGFHIVEKERFPEKIWHDCEKCPKRAHCDEIAVIDQF